MTDTALSDDAKLRLTEGRTFQPLRLSRAAALFMIFALGFTPFRLRADEVRIQNGDHYAGQVLGLTTNRLVLQSAVLGRVTLARRQVASITLAPAATNQAASAHPATNSSDEVWMQNGDRYAGQVLSLNTNTLVLQSPVLGKVSLSRCEVASITLARVSTNQTVIPLFAADPSAPAAPSSSVADGLRQMSQTGGTIGDLQNQLLNNAGPEANKQFNDMVAGLMSGKLGVNDIRAQAQSMADQVRALKRDLGNDPAADAVDSYLEILDSFLQQSAPAAGKPSPPAKK